MGRRIVLVGAGHAHLHVLLHGRRLTDAGHRLTLVEPDGFWYSGLATGMLGGGYDPSEDRVDPGPLVRRAGGSWIRDRLVGLDAPAGRLRLASGRELGCDVLSLNVGSEVAPAGIAGAEARAVPVKPIVALRDLRRRLERRLAASAGDPLRAVVVGGGATGCEVAANLLALAARRGADARVSLLTSGRRLLERHPARAGRRLRRHLERRGLEVRTSCRVTAVADGAVRTGEGERLPAEVAVLATGLRAPAWLADLGLPLGPRGGVRVAPTLEAEARAPRPPAGGPAPRRLRAFAVGDCADLVGRPLPRLGVYAVRQAPVLLENLGAAAEDGPLRRYRPQPVALSILNLGDGRGLALWGPLHWLGAGAMWLKDRLDRRFLERHRPA